MVDNYGLGSDGWERLAYLFEGNDLARRLTDEVEMDRLGHDPRLKLIVLSDQHMFSLEGRSERGRDGVRQISRMAAERLRRQWHITRLDGRGMFNTELADATRHTDPDCCEGRGWGCIFCAKIEEPYRLMMPKLKGKRHRRD